MSTREVAPKDDDPAAPLVEAIRSTTLRTPPGPTCSVKIGRCDMDVPALLANAKKVRCVGGRVYSGCVG